MRSTVRSVFSAVRRTSAGVLLGVLVCLYAGCGTMPDPLSDTFEAPRVIPVKPGSKAEAEALQKKVEGDSFPTPEEAGM